MSDFDGHTPGPWKLGKELTAHSGEWLISCDVADRGQGMPIAETRPGSGQEYANARLIAAAPDLLAENERLRELIARTLYHADHLLLDLPREMVQEFREALTGQGGGDD